MAKDSFVPECLPLDENHQKEFNLKLKKIKAKVRDDGERPGVVYLGHIPHGFFERQMRQFFSQFGTVNRLRIARSKKTGKIKGYAFIEFKSDVVARIVAETMNNYLMFHRLLKCQYVPSEKVHEETFKGCDRKFSKPVSHLVAMQRHNKHRDPLAEKAQQRRLHKKMSRKMKTLEQLGVKMSLLGPETSQQRSDSVMSGEFHVLDDEVASDDDITFKTPPNTIKASKLKTPGIDYKKTPHGTVKVSKTPLSQRVDIKTPMSKQTGGKTSLSKKTSGKTPLSKETGIKTQLKDSVKKKIVLDNTMKTVCVDKVETPEQLKTTAPKAKGKRKSVSSAAVTPVVKSAKKAKKQ